MASWQKLPYAIQERCLGFLDVRSICAVGSASRSMLTLRASLAQGSSELSISSDVEAKSRGMDVTSSALLGMCSTPQICVVFTKARQQMMRQGNEVLAKLPRSTKVMVISGEDVQNQIMPGVEATVKLSVMLGSFGGSPVHGAAMDINDKEGTLEALAKFERDLRAQTPHGEDSHSYWKAFMVISMSNTEPELIDIVLKGLTNEHPGSSVFGGLCGLCASRFDGSSKINLVTTTGCYILAWGGNVPIRLITCPAIENEPMGPTFRVVECSLGYPVTRLRAEGPEFVYASEPQEVNHPLGCGITKLRDSNGIEVTPDEIDLPNENVRYAFRHADRSVQDGFTLIGAKLVPDAYKSVLHTSSTRDLTGATLAFFPMTEKGLKENVENGLKGLSRHLVQANESIIGSLFFSCVARGPRENGSLPAMYDAGTFSKAFPGVGLAGFYCYGEIGPTVAVGKEQDLIQVGKAVSLQSFLCVFAVFVKDAKRSGSNSRVVDAELLARRFLDGEASL